MDKVTNIVSNSVKDSVLYQDSSSHSSVALPLSPGRLGSSMPIDGFHGSLTESQTHHWHGTGRVFTEGCRCMYKSFTMSALVVDPCNVAPVTINMVPDVALLTIFDIYMDEEKIETWQTLVHVCRKWRNIVFGSPRRLNLRLFCTARALRRRKLVSGRCCL